jgi:hypothetical protein
MMRWLEKLDDRLFSPPHTFATVLSLVAARLALFSDSASEIAGSDENQRQREASSTPREGG